MILKCSWEVKTSKCQISCRVFEVYCQFLGGMAELFFLPEGFSSMDTFYSGRQPQPAGADHGPQEGGPADADQLPDKHPVPRVPPHTRRHNRLSRCVILHSIQYVC